MAAEAKIKKKKTNQRIATPEAERETPGGEMTEKPQQRPGSSSNDLFAKNQITSYAVRHDVVNTNLQ